MGKEPDKPAFKVFRYETIFEKVYLEATSADNADDFYRRITGRDPAKDRSRMTILQSCGFDEKSIGVPRSKIVDKPAKYNNVVTDPSPRKKRTPRHQGVGSHIPPEIDELPRMAEIQPPWINSKNRLIRWLPNECFFCERSYEVVGRITKDHLWPKALGGRVIVPSCPECNTAKGCRLPTDKEVEKFIKWCQVAFDKMTEQQQRQYLLRLRESDRKIYGY